MAALKIEGTLPQILNQVLQELGGGKRVDLFNTVEVGWDEGFSNPATGIVCVTWEEPRAIVWGFLEGTEGPPSGFEVTVLALHGRLSGAKPQHTRKHVKTVFPGIGIRWMWERESGLIRFNIWIGHGTKASNAPWSSDQGTIMRRLQAEEQKYERGLQKLARAISSRDKLE